MKLWKKIVLALGIVFLILQFIRPERNLGPASTHAIGEKFTIPPGVQKVLERSCFNCHTNHTNYPWYADVQPAGWLLAQHIKDGKQGLNFDEFTTYRLSKQYHRFQDIIDKLEADEMPLPSYLLIHWDAKLSPAEKGNLIEWCTAMQDSMRAKYPVDSLERRLRR